MYCTIELPSCCGSVQARLIFMELEPGHAMVCPLCGASAEFIEPASVDAKSIRCLECGDYDISGCTWELGILPLLQADQRRKALANAKRHALTPAGLKSTAT